LHSSRSVYLMIRMEVRIERRMLRGAPRGDRAARAGESNEADGQVGKKRELVDLMVEDLLLALHVNLQRGERWLLLLPASCA
jgi:hypothetical protein